RYLKDTDEGASVVPRAGGGAGLPAGIPAVFSLIYMTP
ncbi:MAG: hypothetical protein RL108_588, partial [Bacteroidota bacterium]